MEIQMTETTNVYTISKLLTILNKLDKELTNIDTINNKAEQGNRNIEMITSVTTEEKFNSSITKAFGIHKDILNELSKKNKLADIMFQIKDIINHVNHEKNISMYIQKKAILNKKLTIYKNILNQIKYYKMSPIQTFETYKAQINNDNTSVSYTVPVVDENLMAAIQNYIDNIKNDLDETNDTIAHLNHSTEITLPANIVKELKILKIIS